MICEIDGWVPGGMQSGVLAQVLRFGIWFGCCVEVQELFLGVLMTARCVFVRLTARCCGACGLGILTQVLFWDAFFGVA